MSYGTPGFSGPPPAYSSVSTAGPSNEPRDFDEIPDDFTHKVYVPVSEYDVEVRLGKFYTLFMLLYLNVIFYDTKF
jgi:hypothetical protein